MIEEAYVSYETARLLQEKGFDGEIHTTFDKEGYTQEFITLQMAMKWLREVHNIYMDISPTHSPNEPIHFIWQTYNSDYLVTGDCDIFYPTYEKACEAAIKYCLENLI